MLKLYDTHGVEYKIAKIDSHECLVWRKCDGDDGLKWGSLHIFEKSALSESPPQTANDELRAEADQVRVEIFKLKLERDARIKEAAAAEQEAEERMARTYMVALEKQELTIRNRKIEELRAQLEVLAPDMEWK